MTYFTNMLQFKYQSQIVKCKFWEYAKFNKFPFNVISQTIWRFLDVAFLKIDFEKSTCLDQQIYKYKFYRNSFHKNLSPSDSRTVLVQLVHTLENFTN